MANPIGRGWLPQSVEWQDDEPVIIMAYLGDRRPQAPFLFQDLTADLPTSRVALRESRRDLSNPHARPTGFIFHMARCGSTLVSGMLSSIDRYRVLSEPVALSELLLPPAPLSDDLHLRYLNCLMDLYAQGLHEEDQPLFVKWPSWAVLDAERITRAFPGVPSCFLYRDPVEVMVSLLARPAAWMHCRRLAERQIDPPPRIAGPGTPADVVFCAQTLARFCAVAVQRSATMSAIDYADLPDALWTRIACFFDVQLSTSDIGSMQTCSRFDAKDPSRTKSFQPDAAHKQCLATTEMRNLAEEYVWPVIRQLQKL